jgi:hypothetical protein
MDLEAVKEVLIRRIELIPNIESHGAHRCLIAEATPGGITQLIPKQMIAVLIDIAPIEKEHALQRFPNRKRKTPIQIALYEG